MKAKELETDRLILRHWKFADDQAFFKMNSDPRVMEYFPSTLTVDESLDFSRKIEEELQTKGYGLWALQVKNGPKFIGFVGLHEVSFQADFTPAVEIGWRLCFDSWGKGYAFEAAIEVLRYAFSDLHLQKIISFTAVQNIRSQKLMQKLGMTKECDFRNPKLHLDDRLSRHVLFSMTAESYQNRKGE